MDQKSGESQKAILEHLKQRASVLKEKLKLSGFAFFKIQGGNRELLFGEGNFPKLLPQCPENGTQEIATDEFISAITFQSRPLAALYTQITENSERAQVLEVLNQTTAEIACVLNSTEPSRALALDEIVEQIAETEPEKYNWTGIYLLTDPRTLTLEAYRGEPTPHVVIPTVRGVCGAAVREKMTINVPDVNADERYLSCSIKTKSEIVVPIFIGEEVVGEIDVDSHLPAAFGPADETSLARFATHIADLLTSLKK